MKHVLSILLCVVLVTLTGCSDREGHPVTPDAGHAADHQPAVATHTAEAPGHETGADPAGAEEAYPVGYCVVSGETLGAMGDGVEVVVDGRTVKLCCDACVSKLRRDPAKYLAILDNAAGGTDTRPAGDAQHSGEHGHAH